MAGKIWHSKWFSHKLIPNASASIHKLALSAVQHTHTHTQKIHTHTHTGSNKNCQIAENLSPINRTNRSPNFAAFRLLFLTFSLHTFARTVEIQIPVLPWRQRATQEAQPAQRHVLHAPRHLVDQHRLEALSVEALVLPEHSAQVSKAITSFMLTTLHTYPRPLSLSSFQLSPAGDNNHNATQWRRSQWRRTHAHHGRLAQRECQLWVRAPWRLRPAQGSTAEPPAAHAGVALELKRGQLGWPNGDYRKSSCRSATLSFK